MTASVHSHTDIVSRGDGDSAAAIGAAIERLERAYRTRRPCPPVRDLLGADNVAAAYAVQRRRVEARTAGGARIVGRKIGLTAPVVQRQLGVDQPDSGVLLDDMRLAEGSTVAAGRLLQPKVEAEIAFILGTDLDGATDLRTIRAAVHHAVAAIEIVDSRIADWDITIADTVADNASCGLFVLGDRQVSLDDIDPVAATMALYVDDEQVSSGTGAECLGDPLIALQWLARTAQEFGDPLRSGQIILSGALGPMVVAEPGRRVCAEVSGLGRVTVRFGEGDER
ncbi:2-keto-4-pentenoate hydratase [Gordonia pseudamarae]|jgi:2-keto-4-pentenoate hydratase|uniref:2-keto-4-pentenoate hydratase n=1 Tax=Gordonia pseudamarae TaxID=2831662 RepID=A0ABX6IHS6_9ACTN|nr:MULTISPECIES: fumarylacetoacetate hydrolase family protein [Gordonia]MBD0023559.1 fumarylacetoacetate hydrolase family protein [Gordonia sp. (in: high G+C Gram-positive bacteria)]QHN26002.1 2-keto-4-pentenoate hydratase [Gordonia pseudamarae]QHN34926.1 2-keto-4-pentenoate hydratase [Gordonia pseudamarae]